MMACVQDDWLQIAAEALRKPLSFGRTPQPWDGQIDMKAPDMKWAAAGFVGGFLLCYLLLGAFRATPPRAAFLTKAAPITWSSVPSVSLVVTNVQLRELHIVEPDRWLDQLPGMPFNHRRSGYSLDLIDTRYQPPPLLEKP